jgi:signal transduction histidine kinase
LQQSREALREAEKILAVAEDRERIARDLHDTVIQRLFGEGLNLHATIPLVNEQAATRLNSTIDGLDETIKELRMAVFFLHGSAASPNGLRGRIVDAMTDATGALGFEPRLQFDGPIDSIEDNIADHLISVLREAMTNVARHAHARSARISVTVDRDVTLTVSDDGVGVPPAEVLGGHGNRNRAERAAALGGTSRLENGDAGGAVLTWCVPAAGGRGPTMTNEDALEIDTIVV